MARLKCANCGFTGEGEEFPDAKDVTLRHQMGDIYSDRECPKCRALAFPETRPDACPKVLIWMEGGLIQTIDGSQEIEALVIDADTEGEDPENIRTIKLFGDESRETEFYVNDWGKIEATPEVIEHYFAEARKRDEAKCRS